MHYILMVKGKMNNMNDYIRALNTNRYKGADMKKDNESRVMQAIYEQFGRLRITRKVRMHYRWYEPDKRRDLDNVSAFGRKCIQDALVDTASDLRRDMDGGLYVYIRKPFKTFDFWKVVGFEKCKSLRMVDIDLPMVKWSDDKPWLIEDLKKLEVVDSYE